MGAQNGIIYFDNAATSFPKPNEVLLEMMKCMRQYGGNPGRGTHSLSLAAAEKIYTCRERVAELFGSNHPENVCFTVNTTAAINLVLKGILREGDHVLISDMEHNAVLRPIEKLVREKGISYDVFPTFVTDRNRSAAKICTSIARMCKSNTRMLICSHASNICSSVLPLEQIGAFCHRRGIFFAVDAAQSAGHIPIQLPEMNIDALCAPGHKGLLGPQGCGFVLWGENCPVVETLVEGGSGYLSLEPVMPSELPERFEAGTLPTPAIIGLLGGIRALQRIGADYVYAHEKMLYRKLLDMLLNEKGITVYAPCHEGSVLLFNIDGVSADMIGRELDRRGICIRCGYHCAALAHKTLGTPIGGAVRVSFGYHNKASELEKFVLSLKEIKNEMGTNIARRE